MKLSYSPEVTSGVARGRGAAPARPGRQAPRAFLHLAQYLVIPGAARGGANYASLELGCAVTTRTERELPAVTATAHDQRLRRIPWRTNTDSGVDPPPKLP